MTERSGSFSIRFSRMARMGPCRLKLQQYTLSSRQRQQVRKIHPEQPQRADCHGGAYHRCLSRCELKILGALLKAGKNLLRLAAAGPHTGLNSHEKPALTSKWFSGKNAPIP